MNKINIFAAMLSLLVATGCAGCGDDDDTDAPTLTDFDIKISPENPTAKFGGDTLTISVEAPADWSVSSQSDFCTLSKRGGVKGASDFKAYLSKNTSADNRTATLTFTSGTSRKAYQIVQGYDEASFDSGEITAPEGYRLVWHDEFDGDALSSDWTYEVQNSYWVNNELQNYVKAQVDGKKTVEVGGDVLSINCFKASDNKVYSGRIYAKVNEGWQYGYIEARIKLPKGKGTWPAFWMMPVNVDWATEPWPICGEIDIMEEVGANPNYVSSSLHAEGHVHTKGNQVTHEMLCQGAEDDFHTYAMEWTSEKIVTYVDGKVQLSYASDGTTTNYPYDKPYYVILNLAWGGDWGGYMGVDEAALPTTMQVDYVRVFKKK